YLAGPKESYAFSLTREGFEWRTISLDEKDMAAKVAAFRRGLDVDELTKSVSMGKAHLFDLAAAHELYVALFWPVGALIKDKRLLLIVPSGPLTPAPALHLPTLFCTASLLVARATTCRISVVAIDEADLVHAALRTDRPLRARRLQQGRNSCRAAAGNEHVGRERGQFGRMPAKAVGIGRGPARVNLHVAANRPAQLRQCLQKRPDAHLRIWIVRRQGHEHADAPHAVGLLLARRERPRRRAAEQSDFRAPLHPLELHPLPLATHAAYRIVDIPSG